MGLFYAHGTLYCQNDEVSPDVHTSVRSTARSQISLWSIFPGPSECRPWHVYPLTFSTDPVFMVLQEIMTETGIWGRLRYEACGRVSGGRFWVNSGSILGLILSKTGPEFSKTGTKFSKTGPKTVKTQSNGRANLYT